MTALPPELDIDLGGPAVTRYPTMRLANIGDDVVLALCNHRNSDVIDIETQKPSLKENGKPRQQKTVTAIIVDPRSAQVQTGRDEMGEPIRRPAEKGEVVCWYVQGARWTAWIDGYRALGNEKVGDILHVKFDRTEKPQNPVHKPTQIFSMKVRRPDPAKDMESVIAAVETYKKLMSEQALGSVASAPMGGGGYSDDDF